MYQLRNCKLYKFINLPILTTLMSLSSSRNLYKRYLQVLRRTNNLRKTVALYEGSRQVAVFESASEMARQLGMSSTGVSLAIKRGSLIQKRYRAVRTSG